MQLRQFNQSPADYQAITDLENAIWPDMPSTVESMRHSHDTRPKDIYWQEHVAVMDDRIVGFVALGETFWSWSPGKFSVYVVVDPAHQRQGIGRQLYDYGLAQLQAAHQVKALTAGTREDKPDSLQFLKSRGFVQNIREPVSALDVSAFDPAPFAAREDQVRANGISIHSLQELAAECPDWQERYWKLDLAISPDIPSPEPFTPRPLDEWIKSQCESPDFDTATRWVARQGEEWVGISELWITKASADKAFTGLTGVTRQARRKGVATALKLQAIQYARDHGFQTIVTDNEENNPMFQINLALGFAPLPAWLGFRKDFAANS